MRVLQADAKVVPTERLEHEACELAAELAATTCRFLLVVAELDRRRAWASWGCQSMAHWLSYRCGVSLSTGREHVRVGRALAALPRITAGFAAGELSYSKVRALVRIATADTEDELIRLAHVATAAQLEQLVAGYLGATRDAAASQLARRSIRHYFDRDGSLVVLVRMPRDAGVVFLAALEAARDQIPADASAEADDPAAARRCDALEQIVRAFSSGGSGGGSPGAPRTELRLHADLATLVDEERGELLRTLGCDASVVLHVERHGRTLEVCGRKRTIPAALRRAIERRDGGRCRFAGCANRRFLHVHHLVHYAQGGRTAADNLLLLCPFHHRLVHAGGWRVRGRVDGDLSFESPRGRVVGAPSPPSGSARPRTRRRVDPTVISSAHGEPLDLDWAVTGLISLFARKARAASGRYPPV
jgi:hypothetical protein